MGIQTSLPCTIRNPEFDWRNENAYVYLAREGRSRGLDPHRDQPHQQSMLFMHQRELLHEAAIALLRREALRQLRSVVPEQRGHRDKEGERPAQSEGVV